MQDGSQSRVGASTERAQPKQRWAAADRHFYFSTSDDEHCRFKPCLAKCSELKRGSAKQRANASSRKGVYSDKRSRIAAIRVEVNRHARPSDQKEGAGVGAGSWLFLTTCTLGSPRYGARFREWHHVGTATVFICRNTKDANELREC